jgi:hypothetical protein
MRDSKSGTATDGTGPEWIAHAAARAVMEEFRHLLATSRLDPRPWHPVPILCGLPGVGKTAVCERFIEEVRVVPSSPYLPVEWPAARFDMPLSCSEDDIGQRIHGAMSDHWRVEGLGRTTLLFADGADALLDVSRAKRNLALALLRAKWDRFLFVLVGSPELAELLALDLRYELIPLVPLSTGAEFSTVVAALGGTVDDEGLDRLHRETGGVMGRLLSLARRGRLGRPVRGVLPTTPLLPR